MARKRAGTSPTFLFLLVVAVGGFMLSMAGCDRITSTFRSLRKSIDTRKEHAPARPTRHAGAGPRLAILLDDLGSDPQAAEAIFALHQPLTISVLPFHEHSAQIAEAAKQHGIEVMLHLPMQAMGNELPEARQLHSGMNGAEVAQEVSAMLKDVPTAAGVNNHEGSLATTDPELMAELMPLLKTRSLYFVDSRTTSATVAFDAARQAGLRCAFRNVPFLDDVQEVGAIRKQLEAALRGAEEKGAAIAIGHPHKETLEALREMLPQAQSQGVSLVFVSDVVK